MIALKMSPVFAMNWPAIHLRGTPQPSRTVRTWVQSTSYTVDPLPCLGNRTLSPEEVRGVGTLRPGERREAQRQPPAQSQRHLSGKRGGRNDRQEPAGRSSKPLNPLSCGLMGRLRVALWG